MRPCLLFFCSLISLGTCLPPIVRNRLLTDDGASRSLLRSSEKSDSYELFETDCSSTDTTSTHSSVTVIRNSENTPIEYSLSVYIYGVPKCDSSEYVVMNTRTSLSPKSELNQYQGQVLSTTFAVSGVMNSILKCSSVITDGITNNVDDVRCEDANGENPFAKVTGVVGRSRIISLRPSEKGIQIDDELFGVIDASLAKSDEEESLQAVDGSVGKSSAKPKPKPHPHPHPHPSGGGGSIGDADVWVLVVILGIVVLIAVILCIISCCRSNGTDSAPLMDSNYYNGNQYDNGYYEGYYDGYHDGEYDGGDGGYDGGDGGDGGDCGGGDSSVCWYKNAITCNP